MDFNNIIGNNLRLYRKHLNYSQDQVANLLKVDRSTVSHYENGEREIPFVHLKSLCDLFGIELSNLSESDKVVIRSNFAFAFRKENLDGNALASIAQFQKIVKNYLKLRELASE